ncbi:MAG: hypothetical protein F6K09_28140 [Merismopedia sp. SIO2A8]|nr:hypothetical protein [Merismopedia sp. SIO2A8]
MQNPCSTKSQFTEGDSLFSYEFAILTTSLTNTELMYNKNSHQDLLGAVITAALGAGIVTSFAVSQGQNPLVALAITIFSALIAVLCVQAGLI